MVQYILTIVTQQEQFSNMSIFTYYPKIAYKVDDYNFLKAIDINVVTKIKDYLTQYRGISYTPYVVADGESPDFISYKFYEDPGYDWIIMLTNNVHSIYDDWPKNSETFRQYIVDKYGSLQNAMSTTKYYYDAKGNVIDILEYSNLTSSNRSAETIYEYELRLNVNKSKIKILNRSAINSVESGLRSILSKPIL
jgi:hypothetical protein